MKLDWTHKDVTITDIRKISNLYILAIDDSNIKPPLLVNEKIFNERLKLYFLKEPHKIDRNEILSVKWNMYITQNYYIKVNENEEIIKYEQKDNKWYISYLEISGVLSDFSSVYNHDKK
jgi:hypothetical protein